MEHFSLDIGAPLTELEKECLSSGRALRDILSVMDLVRSDPRPRRHARNIIAASIFAMYRINAISGYSHFSIQSFGIANTMIGPITNANFFLKKSERIGILTDLCAFHRTIKVIVNGPITGSLVQLHGVLTPKIQLFDNKGFLLQEIESSLLSSGARTISMRPDDTGEFSIEVSGVIAESDFLNAFSKLSVHTASPKIVYHQVPFEKVQQEAGDIQMGDYTCSDFPFLEHGRSDDVKRILGGVAKGTVGALLLIASS